MLLHLLAFFDGLYGFASLIVEIDGFALRKRQDGHGRTAAWRHRARMRLPIGDEPTGFVPGCRLILEVAVDALS